VVDKEGNYVLITSTINLEFGAKFMDPKSGIIFNNEMDDFYVPSVKNAFDLAGMPKNIVQPGKRPFSSASPVILNGVGEVIAIGAAGGTRIPTTVIGIIFHLVLGKTLKESIHELRIHNQFFPGKTYVENGVCGCVKDYLGSVGHVVEESLVNSVFTSAQGIHVVEVDGKRIIQAVSDERKGGASFGY